MDKTQNGEVAGRCTHSRKGSCLELRTHCVSPCLYKIKFKTKLHESLSLQDQIQDKRDKKQDK